MNYIRIAFVVLAFAPFIVADNYFENVLPEEDPEVEIEPNVIADMIGAASKNMASPHIVGGHVATPHSYPHQVAVISKKKDGKQSLCGGSLIDPEWVLTAAHCGTDTVEMIAAVGAHNLSSPETSKQMIPVLKGYVPRTWNITNVANDILLVRLKTPAKLNDFVQLIRLPAVSQRNKDLNGEAVEVAGWGRDSDWRPVFSPVLRAVATTVIDNAHCNRYYVGKIQLFHLCADGSKAKGVCNGDSGGPMIMRESDGKRTLVGITSFGSREGCEKSFPTVFTKVPLYLDWISNITGIKLRD